tara:strand:- start:17305 stop:17889 length:585 start_codon:yes stop_codon:yes gene_type:complete
MHDGCDGNKILTWSLDSFDLENPEGSGIYLADIAKALGNLCRFTGQCDFYSVAEHSVHCCRIALSNHPGNWELAFAALMHDAAEAYTGDISKPLKKMIEPIFGPIEKRIEDAVRARFKIDNRYDHQVKIIDMGMLKAEKRHLFPKSPLAENLDEYPDYAVQFGMLPPKKASLLFLDMYVDVCSKLTITKERDND